MTLHRTQVLLEEGQFRSLAQRARRRGLSVAAYIRDLVENDLAERQPKAALRALAGLGTAPPLDEADHDSAIYDVDP